MNILDKIIADKRKEVELKKSVITFSQLENSKLFERKTISIRQKLKNSTSGIIAEFKRRSPSKSMINQTANVGDVAVGYEKAGVAGMSVLTDLKYFGGSLEDLIIARASCDLPLLRKEFIVDEFQILEAKSSGADFILLIAAVLTKEEIKTFSELAKQLDLEVLLEVHNREELEKSIMPSLDLIGVNNRNLKTMEVDLGTSKSLAEFIPNEYVKISESGISDVDSIKELKNYGFQGFLIGENFMKTENPGESARKFIQNLER
ncbi:indole-3-glycerol phosphate synthase TrpC [Moheibacter lacus]|uniref:Indole-3-glycerol phosphate synthase n=1 Tax=Moheibacter lacus TaxID=2745851 RepID=A0A838ZRY4_9FLAO|nr:indole-3-glycerol phosphate synthase TrpC [Moheibacter lacus]MBA5628679.1 indole-3-glycerol phosphate synthase TrpC [Moheibacter lacus]